MAGKVQLAVQLERQFAENIEADYSFTTTERIAYLGNPLRYPGQVVYDTDLDALFFLDASNTWMSIGGTPAIDDTDDVPEGATNKYFTEDKVRATLLTGLVTTATNVVISATESVLVGIGKLQGQISHLLARIVSNTNYDSTETKISTTQAVNRLSNGVALASHATGFLRTDDSFTMSKVDDFTLGISASQYGIAFRSYFETSTPDPAAGIKMLTARNIALSTVASSVTIADGANKVVYVGWSMPSDTIVFSESSYVQSKTVCQLGLIFVKRVGSTYSFTDTNRTFVNIPDISAYSNLLTTTVGLSSNVVAAPNTGLTIKTSAGSVQGISVNWGASNTDERTVAGQLPTTFSPLNPGNINTIPLPSATTTIDPTQYWNGSSMISLTGANNAQVMRVLITNRGTFIVQPGETEYASLSVAKDNAFLQTYTNFIPKDTFTEVARIAVRKGAGNLADTTDAVFFVRGAGGGGSTGTATFTSIGGDPYDNTLLAEDLNGKANLELALNTQTGSYTLALTDAGDTVLMNVASANTLTVPPNSSVAFPVGTQIVLVQIGAGQTTVVAGSGVTVSSSGNRLKLTSQYSGATLIKTATNSWLLFGDLTA